jgi:putative resolvase
VGLRSVDELPVQETLQQEAVSATAHIGDQERAAGLYTALKELCMKLCSIGELAELLGVAVVTLRRWHAAGSLLPACRTAGGHRRYDLLQVRQHFGLDGGPERKTPAYGRVSSHDQSERLVTQAERLRRHCAAQGYARAEVITDPGSGMNYEKRGLQRLVREVLSGAAVKGER